MKRNVQSLSICVPGNTCINQCKYCVACMQADSYKNQMNENLPFFDLYLNDYVDRMIFAKENDANTMMITGDIEPLQNRSFLQTLSMINNYILPQMGSSSFKWIELQTSGVLFDKNYARFLRNTVRVSILSLSLASFDNDKNAEIQQMKENIAVNISEVCSIAKEYDFTLRLSLNMNQAILSSVEGGIEGIFKKVAELGANQLTFRKLYTSGDNDQTNWIRENTADESFFTEVNQYVKENGRLLGTLPYGYKQYSVNGISVVIDEDSMNEGKKEKETSKYFVLRPDCKLYDGWNRDEEIF